MCFNLCTATSGGRRVDLSATEFGACYYSNMRLIIRVCCDNDGQLFIQSWPWFDLDLVSRDLANAAVSYYSSLGSGKMRYEPS